MATSFFDCTVPKRLV